MVSFHYAQAMKKKDLNPKFGIHGIYELGRSFIIGREVEISAIHPAMVQQYIQNAKRILSRRAKFKPRVFEEVLIELESKMPDLIYRMLNGSVTILDARELPHRLKSFPAIRSTAMANAYIASTPTLIGPT